MKEFTRSCPAQATTISYSRLARVYRTTEELVEAVEADVIGEIPSWLQGTFIRAGPGLFDLSSSFQLNHIFDGYSILSKFVINGNEIKFHKKFLESEAAKRAIDSGRPTICEFGTRAFPDPQKGLFSRFIPNLVRIQRSLHTKMTLASTALKFIQACSIQSASVDFLLVQVPPLSDNCNMGVFRIGSKTFASTETNYIREINPDTLETLDKFDCLKMYGLNSMSSHPLVDEFTGNIYNIGPSMITGLKYNILKYPPSKPGNDTMSTRDLLKRGKVISSISSSWNGLLSFNHSFAMTRNYIIIIEQPYVFVASKVLGGIVTKNLCILDWLDWKPDLTNHFLIIEKSTGKLLKIDIVSESPFFFLHVVNAFEDDEGEYIVIDLSIFPNPNVLENMTVEKLRNGDFHEEDMPQAARFLLPLNPNQQHSLIDEEGQLINCSIKTKATITQLGQRFYVKPEIISPDPPGLEMPTINTKYSSKKHEYFYGTGSVTNGHWANSIAKVSIMDLHHKALVWKKSRSYYVGEPIFIPRPGGTSEDDGLLLSAVITDGHLNQKEHEGDEERLVNDKGRDFLLFLDARTMDEIGRAYVNCHLPMGVHGTFLPK